MSDEQLVICPKCSKPALKRLISGGSGLHFKGSGFYLTDYKKTSSSPSTATDSAPKQVAESKPSDSKKADSSASGGKDTKKSP
jgi:predicted nucleic acid-binding Zn ribbon protein